MLSKMKKIGLGLVAMVAGTSAANAAVPAEASAALTGIVTDGQSLIAEGWPVIAAIVGAFVLFKIFKRVVSAST